MSAATSIKMADHTLMARSPYFEENGVPPSSPMANSSPTSPLEPSLESLPSKFTSETLSVSTDQMRKPAHPTCSPFPSSKLNESCRLQSELELEEFDIITKNTNVKNLDDLDSSSDFFVCEKRKKRKPLLKEIVKIPRLEMRTDNSVLMSCYLNSKINREPENVSNSNANNCESSTDSEFGDEVPQNYSQELFDINHLIVSNKCPVCLKLFNQDTVVAHVKKCAYKNKLTTSKLFEVLRLQKKHDEERQKIGLPLVPEKSTKRKRASKVISTGLNSNTELALALSKSEIEFKEKQILEEVESLAAAGLPEEAAARLRTLEGFGFSSSSSSTAVDLPSTSKEMRYRRAPLITRSAQEKENMLMEKIENVILEVDNQMEVDQHKFTEKSIVPKSSALRQLFNENSNLWNLASLPDPLTEVYYVASLSPVVIPSNTEMGRLLKHVSQLPGRDKSPTRAPFSIDDDKHFDSS